MEVPTVGLLRISELVIDPLNPRTFIGLDVQKAKILVAIAQGERGGEVWHLGTVPHRADQMRKLVKKLAAGGARL